MKAKILISKILKIVSVQFRLTEVVLTHQPKSQTKQFQRCTIMGYE